MNSNNNSTINSGENDKVELNNVQNTISNNNPGNNLSNNEPLNKVEKTKEDKNKKNHNGLVIFLLLIVILMLGLYIVIDYREDLMNKCSPLISSDNTIRKLDLNSNIVVDLYNKVRTNIKEDIASNVLDNNMKLYLAYRQIPNSKIYDSNCNLFDNNLMNSYKCEESIEFFPRAFKEETLQLEVKKLFGEDVVIENNNIQLGKSCIGGYQYIFERGEYVEGYCKEVPFMKYKVDKELIDAYVMGEVITLKEKVRYYGSEKVPDRLQNGVYTYMFKLDNNYNYVYVSKTIE